VLEHLGHDHSVPTSLSELQLLWSTTKGLVQISGNRPGTREYMQELQVKLLNGTCGEQILHQVLVAKDIITRQFSEHDFKRALLPARRIYLWILIFTQMHDVIQEQLVMGEGTARPLRMDSPEV